MKAVYEGPPLPKEVQDVLLDENGTPQSFRIGMIEAIKVMKGPELANLARNLRTIHDMRTGITPELTFNK